MSDTEKAIIFSSFSDEELVSFIRDGHEKAFDELAGRYIKTVSFLSGKYFSAELTHDDWFQEGMIGFILAVRTFDRSKDVSFATYASVCISNKLRTVWKKANRIVDTVLDLSDTFDSPIQSTEENYIESENYMFFTEKLLSTLSETEKKVISYYLAGFSYSETAKETGLTEKSVDNALFRAKAKLKKALKQ